MQRNPYRCGALPMSQDERIKALEETVDLMMMHVHDLERNYETLRKRLGTLLPERYHCRHCKAMISQLSEVCGSCGKVLRVPTDPKAGQPR